jgi:hypothetical protein
MGLSQHTWDVERVGGLRAQSSIVMHQDSPHDYNLVYSLSFNE